MIELTSKTWGDNHVILSIGKVFFGYETRTLLMAACFAVLPGLVGCAPGMPCSNNDDCNGEVCVKGYCEPTDMVGPGVTIGDVTLAISKIDVLDDENNKAVLEQGKTRRLSIRVSNSGKAQTSSLSGTLTTSTEGARVSNGMLGNSAPLFFGVIDPGKVGCGVVEPPFGGSCEQSIASIYPAILVSLSADVTKVDLKLDLRDEKGNIFNLTASLNVGIGGGNETQTGDASLQVTSIAVVGDENGDGKISPGEKGALRIYLRNAGSATARGVIGKFSTSTDGVSITLGETLHFEDIKAGATACGATTPGKVGSCAQDKDLPKISIASNVEVGTVIELQLKLTDMDGKEYSVDTSVTVSDIEQVYRVSSVFGSISSGVRSGLQIRVENIGTANGLGLVGLMTASSPGVTISNGGKIYFGNIGSGSECCGSINPSRPGVCGSFYEGVTTPGVSLESSVPSGSSVDFLMSLTDKFDNKFELDFTLEVQ